MGLMIHSLGQLPADAHRDYYVYLLDYGWDEPLGDASIIPTHLLSLFARQHVKVILSGEGADEMFAGYPTYIGNRVAEGFMRIPPSLRSGLIKLARRIAPVSMGNVGVDYLLEQFVASAQKTDRKSVV